MNLSLNRYPIENLFAADTLIRIESISIFCFKRKLQLLPLAAIMFVECLAGRKLIKFRVNANNDEPTFFFHHGANSNKMTYAVSRAVYLMAVSTHDSSGEH